MTGQPTGSLHSLHRPTIVAVAGPALCFVRRVYAGIRLLTLDRRAESGEMPRLNALELVWQVCREVGKLLFWVLVFKVRACMFLSGSLCSMDKRSYLYVASGNLWTSYVVFGD